MVKEMNNNPVPDYSWLGEFQILSIYEEYEPQSPNVLDQLFREGVNMSISNEDSVLNNDCIWYR